MGKLDIFILVPLAVCAILGFAVGRRLGRRYRGKSKPQWLRWAWIGAVIGFLGGIVLYIYMLEFNLI